MGNTSDVYGNIGKSNRWGIEAEVAYSPVDPVRIQVAYTYSHFQYSSPDSVKNHWIPECPQHMLDAQVSWKFMKHFTLTLSTEYQSKWYIQTDASLYNTYTIGATWYQPAITYNSWVKGFNIYNANLAYDCKIGNYKGILSLYVKNIFNQHYYGFTEPDNAPDYNSYQPAPGIEVFGSIKIMI